MLIEAESKYGNSTVLPTPKGVESDLKAFLTLKHSDFKTFLTEPADVGEIFWILERVFYEEV